MLRSLAECSLPADFLLVQDAEDALGHDLFIAFLKNWACDASIDRIHLICYENPPAFYFPKKEMKNEKIVTHDFFSDSCGWSNPSTPVQDLFTFTSDVTKLSETVFIDSLSVLAYQQGFFSMCRDLSVLKRYSKNVLCIAHGDLFSSEQLEEVSFFSSARIKLENCSSDKNCKERMCEVIYKKPGGKVMKQKEFFSVSDEFNVKSRISQAKAVVFSDVKSDIENLSTFKLGLHISKKEKKAKDELVLPYLKREVPNEVGEIFYEPQADDFEDDPDDDLDI